VSTTCRLRGHPLHFLCPRTSILHGPFQHLQMPTLCRPFESVIAPRASMISEPLQDIQMTPLCCRRTCCRIPVAVDGGRSWDGDVGWTPGPFKDMQMTSQCSTGTHPNAHGSPIGPHPLQDFQIPILRSGGGVSLSQGQPFSLAHCNTCKCPFETAEVQVRESQGAPFDRAHWRRGRFPVLAITPQASVCSHCVEREGVGRTPFHLEHTNRHTNQSEFHPGSPGSSAEVLSPVNPCLLYHFIGKNRKVRKRGRWFLQMSLNFLYSHWTRLHYARKDSYEGEI
jgi:hypothetical protein